jgi:hypothetical protein
VPLCHGKEAGWEQNGLYGWFALLVMPCGWLGPVIGLHLVDHWQEVKDEG